MSKKMASKYRRSNPYMGVLVLISLTRRGIGERCTFDETQVFPSPPEFPDFMAYFEGTVLRIGLANLLPSDGPTLHPTTCSPESVNWSEFNSRLCRNEDPLDLELFCNPPSTAESTVALLTTLAKTVVSSTMTSRDLRNDTTTDILNSSSTWFDAESTNSLRTVQPPDHTDSYDSDFKDHSLKDTDYLHHATKGAEFADTVLPSDVGAVNGSTGMAQPQQQGDGASIAIGVGCGLTLLCILSIVVIIALSHNTRESGCRRLMSPLFKVFQRQTSDVRPLTWSLSNQPSTPLEEIRPNGDILTTVTEG